MTKRGKWIPDFDELIIPIRNRDGEEAVVLAVPYLRYDVIRGEYSDGVKHFLEEPHHPSQRKASRQARGNDVSYVRKRLRHSKRLQRENHHRRRRRGEHERLARPSRLHDLRPHTQAPAHMGHRLGEILENRCCLCRLPRRTTHTGWTL